MIKTSEAKSQESGNDNEKRKDNGAPFEYKLVLHMLLSLSVLLILLVLLPLFAPLILKEPKDANDFIEYCKWLSPALLGAFGAWIGAGAAYFFGRENLRLSNESTQNALKTQQQMSMGKNLIKDINLTPLNKDFEFNLEATVEDVMTKLNENVDYWFVPVLEGQKMKDVIHTEALWRYINENPEKDQIKPGQAKLSEVIKYINEKQHTKADKLHGFFREVKMDDNVEMVLGTMNMSGASVGIVCDEQGKPTHCFSRKDLRSFLI